MHIPATWCGVPPIPWIPARAGFQYSCSLSAACHSQHPPLLTLYRLLSTALQDGKVRLYNSKTLSRANTSIPGLGAPVTAIDITFDGKWVLATTDKYLMVIKVR